MSNREFFFVATMTLGLAFANLMGPHWLVRKFAPDGSFILWKVVPRPTLPRRRQPQTPMSSFQRRGLEAMKPRIKPMQASSPRSTIWAPWARSQ